MNRLLFVVCLALGISSFVFSGCNATGSFDNSKSPEEIVKDAQAKMDVGNCNDAASMLMNMPNKTNDAWQVLGWAQLCQGGVTISRVASTLFAYNSTSNNLTVVGDLATRLIPMTDDLINGSLTAAANSFAQITDINSRALNLAFSHIVRAAAITAKSSTNGSSVIRGDISPAACGGTDCTGGGTAVCTTTASGKMTDVDALAVVSALGSAGTAASASGALGSIGALAAQLAAAASLGGADVGRCVVFNSFLTR